MKKVLLIGQLTDLSGYATAARCYLDNLIVLEEEGLIELKVLNISFEKDIFISEEYKQKIAKRSLTSKLKYPSGYCENPDDIQSIQDYIDKKDYEAIFCMTSDMLTFGHDDGKSVFYFELTDKMHPELWGYRFSTLQIAINAQAVHQCIVWETETIPEIWKQSINDDRINVKTLICGCDWNNKSFEPLGKKNITIPYSIDFELGEDEEYYEKIKKVTKDKFVFSSVFQWSERKGFDILIKAFASEFASNPDVCLILKTYSGKASVDEDSLDEKTMFKDVIRHLTSQLSHYTMNYTPKYKIIVINDLLTKREINSIYKASDAFVLPTRGEGFCLPAVESLNYEKPVILPDIGGHLDYLPKDNPYAVESRMEYVEKYKHPLWSSIYSLWVDPSTKSLREKIRLAYEDRDLLKKTGKKQASFMKRHLSKERCVKLFKEVLL